jgi:hypothetical protein
MSTADDFRMEVYRMMNEAIREGRETAESTSGNFTRRLVTAQDGTSNARVLRGHARCSAVHLRRMQMI